MNNTPHRRSAGWSLPRMILLLVAGAGSAAVSGCGSGDRISASREDVPTNLVVLRSVVAGLGRSLLDSIGRLPGDTVTLDVDSSAASWIARTELASALGSAGRRVVLATSAAESSHPRWTVRGLTLGVEYRNIRKDGLFSEAVVDRIVTATFTSEITAGGSVIFAGTTPEAPPTRWGRTASAIWSRVQCISRRGLFPISAHSTASSNRSSSSARPAPLSYYFFR